ncbi:hypothetical protein [Brevundimonas sp. SL130]|uniref:hypothetical protein n=1 Tax=Brevundimonas sp. SL130 TaxID=2995143 RepID=UPI00226D2DD5|nr:hypothetical protein [Brevundimonas sp. SL130]WAC59765.1 hypothetical protein OU998_16395 [Brevundimonas sp. SL130]
MAENLGESSLAPSHDDEHDDEHGPTGPEYEFAVHARAYWSESGVHVTPDQTWLIEAEGAWTDWTNTCGPEGYAAPKLKLFESLRRRPAEAWFALIASIGHDDPAPVAVGQRLLFRPARAGSLAFYANDIPAMYWNNRDRLIVRLRSVVSFTGSTGGASV